MADIVSCHIHPLVFLSIVDYYERRNEDATRVIGTLLGSNDQQGNIEVTDCFTVPHTEYGDEVAVHIEFAKNSSDLHRVVNPSENIVGWFSTGPEVTAHSVLIHDYYTRECKDSIHLTVDTTLKGSTMSMKAYISTPLGVPGKTSGTMFRPIKVDSVMSSAEKVGVDFLLRSKMNPSRVVNLDTDFKQITQTCAQIQKQLSVVSKYVHDVIDGKVPADPSLGRTLTDLVNSVPQVKPEQFQQMINTNMKDLLMVVYLSSLTETQLMLNEKINLL